MISSTKRGSGLDTRMSIERTAAAVFRRQGFGASSLEDIARPLGITRAAVLHHFGSKAALLEAIVTPLFAELDDLLDRMPTDGPVTAREQRRFFSHFVEIACDNRDASALLVRDITVHQHLPPEMQIADRVTRYVRLAVANNEPDPQAPVRALAAIGAITRPLSAPDELVDLSGPESRRVLVDCAMAALRSGR